MSVNKKIALLSVLFCTLTQYASEGSCTNADLTSWLEIKPSYFFFTACPMNTVYNNGGFEVQGSASVPVCKYLDMYGSIGYRKVQGHALNSCSKTSLTVIPIDVGIKPIFNFCEHYYYFFAVGPRYFYFSEHNQSPYVDCKINDIGIGLFVNTGCNVLIADHFLLGIFGEYSYEKKKICPSKSHVFSNGSVQMGGFAFGISLGYAF